MFASAGRRKVFAARGTCSEVLVRVGGFGKGRVLRMAEPGMELAGWRSVR